jgi:hypothetical protein
MTVGERPPASGAELNAGLAELLRRADANGVDVKGGWSCHTDGDRPDWDVVVTEVRTSWE